MAFSKTIQISIIDTKIIAHLISILSFFIVLGVIIYQ